MNGCVITADAVNFEGYIITPKLHPAWVGDALPIGCHTFIVNSVYAEKRKLSNNHDMSFKI